MKRRDHRKISEHNRAEAIWIKASLQYLCYVNVATALNIHEQGFAYVSAYDTSGTRSVDTHFRPPSETWQVITFMYRPNAATLWTVPQL